MPLSDPGRPEPNRRSESQEGYCRQWRAASAAGGRRDAAWKGGVRGLASWGSVPSRACPFITSNLRRDCSQGARAIILSTTLTHVRHAPTHHTDRPVCHSFHCACGLGHWSGECGQPRGPLLTLAFLQSQEVQGPSLERPLSCQLCLEPGHPASPLTCRCLSAHRLALTALQDKSVHVILLGDCPPRGRSCVLTPPPPSPSCLPAAALKCHQRSCG